MMLVDTKILLKWRPSGKGTELGTSKYRSPKPRRFCHFSAREHQANDKGTAE